MEPNEQDIEHQRLLYGELGRYLISFNNLEDQIRDHMVDQFTLSRSGVEYALLLGMRAAPDADEVGWKFVRALFGQFLFHELLNYFYALYRHLLMADEERSDDFYDDHIRTQQKTLIVELEVVRKALSSIGYKRNLVVHGKYELLHERLTNPDQYSWDPFVKDPEEFRRQALRNNLDASRSLSLTKAMKLTQSQKIGWDSKKLTFADWAGLINEIGSAKDKLKRFVQRGNDLFKYVEDRGVVDDSE